jgi:DNA-binding NarL/FixJ family response regulator
MAKPEFKPTDEQRRTVMRTKAAGMAHKDIAAVLRIDEKTLAKHFERELLHGPAIL